MTNKQGLEKFNKSDYRPHPDRNWFNRIMTYFFLGGTLLSIVVIFFIVNTESGRNFASNSILREFVLDIFPNAQLWIYSTLRYQQEIVMIYLYYVLLLFWAGGILVYLFIFNWRRMLDVQKGWFVALQVARELCTFKTMALLVLLQIPVLTGIIFAFGFGIFEPSLTPMVYDDYDHSSRKASLYDVWNSYPGLVIMFVAKIHVIFPISLWMLLQMISIFMCFKKNTFYNPK